MHSIGWQEGRSARDPSLRLKNGYARDDADQDIARQNPDCTMIALQL